MTKKIKFNSVDINVAYVHPVPAYKTIPDWYRSIEPVVNGQETIKKCPPFIDAMMSGYMILLAADIYCDKHGIQQISEMPVVAGHFIEQTDGMEIPPEYKKKAMKWANFFVTKTPKGYSTLFTHPINRIDLPFYTLSGVVETDKFDLPVNLPFFIRKDFNGIIPAGTPIAQAIPFKRTDWEHHVEDEKQVKLPTYRHTMHNPPFGFYKKNFWTRKKYS